MLGTKLKLTEDGIKQMAGDNQKRIEKHKAKRFEYRSISIKNSSCINVKDENGNYYTYHEDYLEVAN